MPIHIASLPVHQDIDDGAAAVYAAWHLSLWISGGLFWLHLVSQADLALLMGSVI